MKYFIVFIMVLGLVIAGFAYKYNSGIAEIKMNKEYIAQYESYLHQRMYGAEVVTLINRIVDHNEQLGLEKLENGKYDESSQQAIRLEILFADNDEKYSFETIYNSGTEQFLTYYGPIEFVCQTIEYYETTKNIKLMTFNQIK